MQQQNAKAEIPWRTWWDGGLWGPVSSAWGIQGWPATFVLDGKGTIRYVNVIGDSLDSAVERLLRERTPE